VKTDRLQKERSSEKEKKREWKDGQQKKGAQTKKVGSITDENSSRERMKFKKGA
jgi:hypothetical protein